MDLASQPQQVEVKTAGIDILPGVLDAKLGSGIPCFAYAPISVFK